MLQQPLSLVLYNLFYYGDSQSQYQLKMFCWWLDNSILSCIYFSNDAQISIEAYEAAQQHSSLKDIPVETIKNCIYLLLFTVVFFYLLLKILFLQIKLEITCSLHNVNNFLYIILKKKHNQTIQFQK